MWRRQHRHQAKPDQNVADGALPALINPSFKSVIPQNQEESGCTCCSRSSHQIEIKLTSKHSWSLLYSAEKDLRFIVTSLYPGSLILLWLQFSIPDSFIAFFD